MGLLERALVACSGELPSDMGGRHAYAGVPADVASQVLAFLYPGGQNA